jgi:hypothetical protein
MPHRRSVPVVLVLCLFAVPAVLGEAPPPQVAAAAAVAADNPMIPAPLAALFESVAAEAKVTIHPDGSGSVPAAMVEVVVARIGPDGKLVTACVNDAAQAKRFFAAPVHEQKQRIINANEGSEK